MHLKSAVILCAVYFCTSVWSTGLNRSQIELCITLYETEIDIPNILKKDFGIKIPEIFFNFDPTKENFVNYNELFVALAYNETFDHFEEPTLMPMEVELYLEKFVTLLKDNKNYGFLPHKQLLRLFKELNIKKKELEKAENLIPKDEKGHAIANQAEFLLIMLDILPEGNGLSQKQLEKFVGLYNETTTSSIDPIKIKKIFEEFEMTRTPPKELFRSNRPAAKELMELLIVTAERSKTAHRNETLLSTPQVRTLVSKFKIIDKNNNGILSGEEAIEFVTDFLIEDPELLTPINLNNIKINVAHYVLFHLIELREVRDDGSLLEELLKKYEIIPK